MTRTAVAARPARPGEIARHPSFAVRPHTMPELLRWRAEADGERLAVTAGDGDMTFAEWHLRAARGARVLVDAGVRPDDCVGLWGKNEDGCAWIAALLAVQYAGGIPIPLSSGSPLSGSAERLVRLSARHVVAGDGSGGLPEVSVLPLDLAGSTVAPLEAPRADPHRAVAIFHTSGTTGLPKATVLSHEAVSFTAAMTESYILAPPSGVPGLGPSDAIQTSVPLYTASGLEHYILVSLWSGCRLVCEPTFDPAETLVTAAREGSTVWLTVPAMMTLTVDAQPEPLADERFRIVWHMGSVASRECVERTAQMFPDCAVLNLYSLTESCAGIVVTHADDALRKPGATGRPVPPARIRVVDGLGRIVGPDTVGEVQFDSPYMFDGYFGNEQATADAFTADGWFRSGDGGSLDADGVLWVTGRLGDTIIRGGINISPQPIEERMMTFSGVTDAVIAAVPHRILGHDIVGLVASDAELNLEQLKTYCLARLPRNEVPRQIFVVDEVPRNDFGKLDRRQARELALARIAETS